jgi:hypothetical protein
MSSSTLTSYWIDGPDPKGPIGYGVTAFSLEDAFNIIMSLGYSLPENKKKIAYRIIRSVDEVPYSFVRRNSGPIVVRGLWAPFSRVGVQT